jgi:hypothetical protein
MDTAMKMKKLTMDDGGMLIFRVTDRRFLSLPIKNPKSTIGSLQSKLRHPSARER